MLSTHITDTLDSCFLKNNYPNSKYTKKNPVLLKKKKELIIISPIPI